MNDINIADFLPKYPDIDQNNPLNPYKKQNLTSVLSSKKEFSDNKLDSLENFPLKKGQLLKHQINIARYMSSNTLYDKILLVHEPGTGKTCTTVGVIELIRKEKSSIRSALIVTTNSVLKKSYRNEIALKCTDGRYLPENLNELTEQEKSIRIKKKISDFYNTEYTIYMLIKRISQMSDLQIIENFSNQIIVMDEIHNLRIDNLENYNQIHRLLHLVQNCKIIIMSGTPMRDSVEEIASIMNLILPLNQQLPTGDKFRQQFIDKKGVLKEKVDYLKKLFNGRISYLKRMTDPRVPIKYESTQNNILYLTMSPEQSSKYITSWKIENDLVLPSNVHKPQRPKTTIQFWQEDQKSKSKNSTYYKNLAYQDLLRYEDEYASLLYQHLKKKKDSDWQILDPIEKQNYKDMVPSKNVYINTREDSLMIFPNNLSYKKGFQTYVREITKIQFPSSSSSSEEKKSVFSKYVLTKSMRQLMENKSIPEKIKWLKKYSVKYAYVIKYILDHPDQNTFVYASLTEGSGIILFSLLLRLMGFSKATGKEKTSGKRYGIILPNKTTTIQRTRLINSFNQPENKQGGRMQVIIGSDAISEGVSLSNVQNIFILTPHWNSSQTSQAIARGIRFGSHNDLIENNISFQVKIFQIAAVPIGGDDKKSIDLKMYEVAREKDVYINSMQKIIKESAWDCSLNYSRNRSSSEKEWKCYGQDQKLPLDYSTYQLYYFSQPSLLLSKLRSIIKENDGLILADLDEILSYEYENGIFDPQEVRRALNGVAENDSDPIDPDLFLKINPLNAQEIIMQKIQSIFSQTFSANLNIISQALKQYTILEIITVLSKIINENLKITNKYGFHSYLREDQNLYYLTNTLINLKDRQLVYYSEFPQLIPEHNIATASNYKIRYDQLLITSIRNYLKQIFSDDQNISIEKLNLISLPQREILLEKSLDVMEQFPNHKFKNKLEQIIDKYQNYIFKVNPSLTISSLIPDQLRCQNRTTKKWNDCQPEDVRLFNSYRKKIVNDIKNNKYKIFGAVNSRIECPPDKDCFCISQVQESDQKGHLVKTGTRCLSIAKFPLIKMIVQDLNLNIPDQISETEIKKIQQKPTNNYETKILKLRDTWNDQERQTLKFWTNQSKKVLCQTIRNFLRENNMIIQDDANCGTSSKKILEEQKQFKKKDPDEEKKITLPFVETLIINQTYEEKYKNTIKTLMKTCFPEINQPDINISFDIAIAFQDKEKRKAVGLLFVDKIKNYLWFTCSLPEYNKEQIIKALIDDVLVKKIAKKPLFLFAKEEEIKSMTNIGFETTPTIINKKTLLKLN